jgi:exopolysaccharide production protein ExoZ
MKPSSGFFASSRTLFPKIMKSTWASGAYLFAFGGGSVAELPRAQIRHSKVEASRKQYASLQAGRGIAACFVALMHAAGYIDSDTRYWQHTGFARAFQGGALGVEYFFVLSGAVILLAHRRDIGRPETIASYLWKRFRRVYPIYWIILTVVVLEYMLRPSVGAAYQRSPWVIISGYLLVHIHLMDANLPVAWTLFHEILFYLVFVACLFRRNLGIIVFSAWGLLSLAACFLRLPPYLHDYLFSPLHLLFLFGMLDTWLLLNRSVRHALSFALAGVAVLTLTWVWVCFRTPLTTAQELLAGSGAALAVLGFAALEKQNRLNVPTPLQLLGDASYSIYLVHYPFLMALAPITYKVWTHARGPVIIPFLMMAVLAIGVGWLVHLWIERPLLRWMA